MKSFLKSLFVLLLIGLVWGSLILVMGPLQTASGIAARIDKHRFGPWNYSIWIIQDCLVNVILGGSHKVTVSSKIGWMSQQGHGNTVKWVEKFVNWGFKVAVGQDNHCQASIEPEDNHKWDPVLAVSGLLIYTGVYAYVALT